MKQYFKRHIGDRYDGWRVRKVDAVFSIIPFIMRTRLDSQNFFEETVPIEHLEMFIRKHKDEMPELSLMHIVMAATIRLIALRPYLNRFVVWNKIFARNHINMSLIIKRKLSNVETMIKPEFEPEDTLYDVVRRVSEEVNKNVADDAVNSSDETCNALLKLPAFVMRFVVKLLYGLDNIGLLPKKLFNVSPWHCSAFITNVGSLGIGPIYHHLYEFGTCSLFIAMGNKQRTITVNAEGKPVTRRSIGLKFVTDERICDGQYYAASMKMMRKLLEKPELLLESPAQVVVDDGVTNKRLI